jgi:hypothetical protein
MIVIFLITVVMFIVTGIGAYVSKNISDEFERMVKRLQG